MKNKATFLLHSFDDLVKHLTNEEAGMLLKAIFDYDIRGIEADFEDRAMIFLFSEIKRSLDRNKEHYEEVCRKRSESAKKRWGKSQIQQNNEVMQMHTEAWKVNTNVKGKIKDKENLKENVNDKGSEANGIADADTQTHKKAYGEFQNVYLTDDEHERVLKNLPEGKRRLESFSAYIEATGKQYSNHYARLINWNFYGGEQNTWKTWESPHQKRRQPGERREPTFDVSEFTKKALNPVYVPPEE